RPVSRPACSRPATPPQTRHTLPAPSCKPESAASRTSPQDSVPSRTSSKLEVPMKIGIDLGTTNSALAYIDEREADDREFPPLHIFETPQLVAPGRVEPRRTLPSFLFLEDGQPVGVYAREQGALVPTRLVHS